MFDVLSPTTPTADPPDRLSPRFNAAQVQVRAGRIDADANPHSAVSGASPSPFHASYSSRSGRNHRGQMSLPGL